MDEFCFLDKRMKFVKKAIATIIHAQNTGTTSVFLNVALRNLDLEMMSLTELKKQLKTGSEEPADAETSTSDVSD